LAFFPIGREPRTNSSTRRCQNARIHDLFRLCAVWPRAMPDQPPEEMGTIAALVFAAVLVVLMIIGVVLLIVR
jgi:hypothetical protein